MPRVVLVEDHVSFRQTLAMIIEQAGFTVTGQAGTVAAARPLLKQADLAVIDLALPDGSALPLIKELRDCNPNALALVLTASVDPYDQAQAVEGGAAGILHKLASVEEIVAALQRLAAGEWLLSRREMADLLRLAAQYRMQDRDAQYALRQLTVRERDVLVALSEGLSSREIAERLCITLDTERTHMMHILSKLGVHSRLEALVFAIRHGAVAIPSLADRDGHRALEDAASA